MDSSLFSPISGQRMSGQIVGQMLDLIRSGQLSEGDRLPPERELATQMGVSRVTVRDALRVLEAMGLVAIRVGSSGGAFVTQPSADIVGESVSNILFMRGFKPQAIAEARLVLELGILDLVVDRITEEDLQALREICQQSRAQLDAGEYNRGLSIGFHTRLAKGAQNEAIAMLAESFSGPLSMAAVRASEVREDAQRQTVIEHERILAALEAGDQDRVSQEMVKHLLRGRHLDEGTQRLLRRETSSP